MTNSENEKLIDNLLVFMNKQVEESGEHINLYLFEFGKDGEDANVFTKQYDLSYDELEKIIKPCLTRQQIKQYWGNGFASLCLTDSGQGRAISVVNAENKPVIAGGGDININTLNANAPAQIGNNNTQNIEYVFNSLIEQIDNSDGSEEEKQEIKSRLRKFLEHPLAKVLISSAPIILEKL